MVWYGMVCKYWCMYVQFVFKPWYIYIIFCIINITCIAPPSFPPFKCRPAEQQHIPSSLGEGAENLTARSFNEWMVGKKRTYFEFNSVYIYIYTSVCVYMYICFLILVAHSIFRKPQKCCTETQTVVLFSSKDQLQKLKRQGWNQL